MNRMPEMKAKPDHSSIKEELMSKLATRCSVILIASGLSGLLTGCPQQPAPTTNVRPIPNNGSVPVASPSVPGTIIVTPTPGPGSTPNSGTNPSTPPDNGNNNPQTNPQPGSGILAISTTSLPTAVLNFNYNVPLQAIEGSGAYRWNVISGNLPNGLSIDTNTGAIFGKPTQTGTFSFEVQVVDNQKGTVAKRTMFILVSDTDNGQLNNLVILSDSLPTAVVDRRYSKILDLTGGTSPVNWDITSGVLPDGLSLNSKTGEISGTPTLKGEETFTIRATDSRGQTRSRTLSLTVNATDSNLTILTAALPVAVTGQHFDFTAAGSCAQFDPSLSARFKATGGSGAYRWSISKGTPPPGMDTTLQSESSTSSSLYNTGYFSTSGDTPNTAGSYTFTVKVQDENGNSASKVFSLEVRPSVVYGFSPGTGSKALKVRLFGVGLTGATSVAFGGVNSAAPVVTPGTCDQVTAQVPGNAIAGLLAVNGAAGTPTTTAPFIPEDIVISEIFTNPALGETQFIELKNIGSSSVNLGGWYLTYTRIDGTLEKLSIPPQILNAGSATFVELSNEMRFDPENATPANALTRVALCKGAPCDDTVDPNQRFRFRDYLQFGPAAPLDGGVMENDAVNNAGIWADNATINLTTLNSPIAPVSGTFGAANVAHYGVNENSFSKSGLLLTNGNADFMGYSGDAVLYFTPTGGPQAGKEQRIRRTFTGVGAGADADRVKFNTSFYQANIKSTNTGDGTAGKGIAVDDISLFSPADFINVVTGSAIRTISQIVGQTIEMSTGLSADVATGNTSDGTTASTVSTTVTAGGVGPNITLASTNNLYVGSNIAFSATNDVRQITAINGNVVTLNSALTGAGAPNGSTVSLTVSGLLLGANQSQFFGPNSTVNVLVHAGQTGQFTVARTITSIPDASHVVLNQPLATAPIDAGNLGDGMAGSEIKLTSLTNFITGDLVLFNGQPCIDGLPCTITVGSGGSNQFRLSQPLQNLAVSDTNTGDGTAANPLEVDSVVGFATNDTVLYNGVVRTVSVITPGFGSSLPKVQLSPPLVLAVSGTNKGDGSSVTSPIEVTPPTTAFKTGSKVTYFGQTATLTLVAAGLNPGIVLTPAPADAALADDPGTGVGLGSAASPLHIKNIFTNYQLNVVGKKLNFPSDATDPLCPPPVGTGTACPVHTISKFTVTGANTADIEFTPVLTTAPANNVSIRLIPSVGNIYPLAAATTTLTGAAGDGSAGLPVNVASVTGFNIGDNVFFTANNQVRKISNIAGTAITLNAPLTTPINSGRMLSQAEFSLNRIPKTGQFTLVPNPNPNPPSTTALTNPTQILSVPTSGAIFLAPKTGTVRKYQSLNFSATLATEAGTAADYGTAAPTKGN